MQIGKILCKRAWQPTQVFLTGESYGQRSLAGYSPRGHKESDTTEQLSMAQQLPSASNPPNPTPSRSWAWRNSDAHGPRCV